MYKRFTPIPVAMAAALAILTGTAWAGPVLESPWPPDVTEMVLMIAAIVVIFGAAFAAAAWSDRKRVSKDSSDIERKKLDRPRIQQRVGGVFAGGIVRPAFLDAFRKLTPVHQMKNPVMFTVWVGTVLMIVLLVSQIAHGQPFVFTVGIGILLLATVLFANFAEAVAEQRGRAQADSLRKTRTETIARKLDKSSGTEINVGSNELRRGDRVVIEAGELIPCDGEIVEGIATVDESAITGESAPVVREAGGDRSSVTGGTKVLTDRIVVEVTADPGETFLDRMIGLVEGAKRQKTPNELALTILLAACTIMFLTVCLTLFVFGRYFSVNLDLASLTALLVCLIPTTIGALLSAIGIAGMDRALRANVIAKSGRAVEVSGDIDVLLLDKTGTITIGNRQATRFFPLDGATDTEVRDLAALSSIADSTPEGKSIVALAERLGSKVAGPASSTAGMTFVEFTAQTRMSGVDLPDGTRLRKGASDTMRRHAEAHGAEIPENLQWIVDEIARNGGTPLVLTRNANPVGVIQLQDVLKEGIRERFERLRRMGLKTVMITGDNPLTAAYIADQAGVDDFMAEAKPEDKLAYIRREQAAGKLVAMMGDGTNDAPALAQADVAVAMNSGTQAAKEAGNMVDLDNDPTKLIEVVEIGKQLLMTRGALTTFSIANDVAKYFAIIPAIFAGAIPALKILDIMHLASPQSAILSATIFNALVIPALIPVALRGVRYRAVGAQALLRRNVFVYGLGGVALPFLVIKLIDLVLVAVGLGGGHA